MNAFSQAMESSWSVHATPASEHYAKAALCLIKDHLVEMEQPLTEEQLKARAAMDQLLASQSLVVLTTLAAGDMLFNNTVIHGRTACEDWPEAERQRVLARLWIRTQEPKSSTEYTESGL